MKFNVTEKVGYWIDAAIEEHGQGENILWETSMMPGPNQEPMVIVFLWFPGAVLGTTLNGSFPISDPLNITKPDMIEMMSEFLRQMREARSQILAQQATEAAQQSTTPPRGAQTPSGLMIG